MSPGRKPPKKVAVTGSPQLLFSRQVGACILQGTGASLGRGAFPDWPALSGACKQAVMNKARRQNVRLPTVSTDVVCGPTTWETVAAPGIQPSALPPPGNVVYEAARQGPN